MNTNRGLLVAAFLLVWGASAASAEEHIGTEPHLRWGVAGFIGTTRAHGENEPTLGIEGGYAINAQWSVGAVIERSERRRDTTLVIAGIGWRPFGPGLRFQLGAGSKDPSGETELVYRLGVAYEFMFENNWFLKPYAAIDFIDNEDNEQVFGVYVGRGF